MNSYERTQVKIAALEKEISTELDALEAAYRSSSPLWEVQEIKAFIAHLTKWLFSAKRSIGQ